MDRYSELPQFLRTTGAFEHRATEAVEPADDYDGRSPCSRWRRASASSRKIVEAIRTRSAQDVTELRRNRPPPRGRILSGLSLLRSNAQPLLCLLLVSDRPRIGQAWSGGAGHPWSPDVGRCIAGWCRPATVCSSGAAPFRECLPGGARVERPHLHYLREQVHRLRAGASQRAIAHDLPGADDRPEVRPVGGRSRLPGCVTATTRRWTACSVVGVVVSAAPSTPPRQTRLAVTLAVPWPASAIACARRRSPCLDYGADGPVGRGDGGFRPGRSTTTTGIQTRARLFPC